MCTIVRGVEFAVILIAAAIVWIALSLGLFGLLVDEFMDMYEIHYTVHVTVLVWFTGLQFCHLDSSFSGGFDGSYSFLDKVWKHVRVV